ncbi:MAG: pyridoxal 5'-phosphate synthase glutaminase subunit PdxT [Candidatus Hydrothermarchaeota archaeon]|nr:pyridoxal 5'-phosphate synthase glutaminase subunit PdxT [Candidatus Hydrothermarchaeota archaeon]
MQIGVLGLQGDVTEHVTILRKFLREEEVKVVKRAKDIEKLDGLVIPGGESTTIGKLMVKYGIDKAVKNKRLAIFGTCAGSILLAKNILNSEQSSLGLMDIKIERNAYGRQRESFEAEIPIPVLGKKPFRAVFIRAPVIREVSRGVDVLAEHRGDVILARQDRYLAASFHSELTEDLRVHEYFISEVVRCVA